MLQGRFTYLPPLVKLVLVFTVILFFGTITTLVMTWMAEPCFGVDIQSTESMMSDVAFMQVFQIIQSFSLFILPSLLAFYFFYNKLHVGISGPDKTTLSIVILTALLIFLSQAFIAFSGWLNHQLELPESMSRLYNWMTAKEEEASELTLLMIRSDNWLQIGITIFMMSILPAIGEEWLFRGILQRELADLFRNKHIAIIVTAILFSAIHMQFLTFLPRFFLGIILGYLFVLSGNLWLSVIGHFVNNFMAIMAMFALTKNGKMEQLDIPVDNPFDILVVFSFMSILMILYLIKTKSETIRQLDTP